MPQKISWTLNVQIVGGPKITASDVLEVDAYDVISVTVPKDGVKVTVEALPATGKGPVRFVSITSDQYGKDLTYSLVVVPSSPGLVELTAPQLLIGKGGAGLFDTVQQIEFTNKLADAAKITVLVGRDAIVPQPV